MPASAVMLAAFERRWPCGGVAPAMPVHPSGQNRKRFAEVPQRSFEALVNISVVTSDLCSPSHRSLSRIGHRLPSPGSWARGSHIVYQEQRYIGVGVSCCSLPGLPIARQVRERLSVAVSTGHRRNHLSV
jgi:hypothetical protein